MKRAFSLLHAALALLALAPEHARATDPDVASPPVSYQYADSLTDPPADPNIVSTPVSYQYLEWPGDENLTFQSSSNVSYFFSGGGNLNVSGTVRTETGLPIAGASISAKRYSGVFWDGTSDGSGAFSIPGLTPMSYMLMATKPGYVTKFFSHDGTAGGNQSVSIIMQALGPAPATDATTRLIAGSAIGSCTPWNQNSTTASRLLVLNASGQWSSSLSLLNPSLPTVVLTHGWKGNPEASGDWTRSMAPSIQSQLGGAGVANIVAWDWHTDAGTVVVPPIDKAACQGLTLGYVLQQSLGVSYSGRLHFVGHSLGTIVNRIACDYVHHALTDSLSGSNPAAGWSAAATRPHVTLLDEAELSSVAQTSVINSASMAGLYALDASAGNGFVAVSAFVVAGSATAIRDWKHPIPVNARWVDNYISAVGFERLEAVNVCLPGGAYASLNPVDAHSYAHVWYRRSVLVSGYGQAPPVGWRRSFEYAGTFPPTGTGLTAGSVWLEDLNTSDQLDMTLVPNSQLGFCARQLAFNYALGYGDALDEVVVEPVEKAIVKGYYASVEFARKTTDTAIKTVGQAYTASTQVMGLFYDAAVDSATDWFNSMEPTTLMTGPMASYELYLSTVPAPPAPVAGKLMQAAAQAPGAWMTVDVPVHAGMLAFDFTVNGDPVEDLVVCAVNDQNIFTLPAKFGRQNAPTSTDMMDISAFAGQTVEFFFGLVGGTSSNCTVAIGNIRFITIPDPAIGIADLGATFGVKWPAAATGWVLESSASLAPGSWQTVAMPNGTSMVNGVKTLEVSKNSDRRFYRLRRLP